MNRVKNIPLMDHNRRSRGGVRATFGMMIKKRYRTRDDDGTHRFVLVDEPVRWRPTQVPPLTRRGRRRRANAVARASRRANRG